MSASYPGTVLDPVVRDPALPDVLSLGDSISVGYIPYTRTTLADVCNIHRPPENCRSTAVGLPGLQQSWVTPCLWYELIVFNFGLHDSHTGSGISTSQYAANLESIISILRLFTDKLSWFRTTDVPVNAVGRTEANTQLYNDAADVVIAGHPDIVVLDLHAYTVANPDWHIDDTEVHYTAEGYEALGDIVSAHILQRLSNG